MALPKNFSPVYFDKAKKDKYNELSDKSCASADVHIVM